MMLQSGLKYDISSLNFTGWTVGDGSGAEGYNVADYFSTEGAYLGADEHGIEPVFDPQGENQSPLKPVNGRHQPSAGAEPLAGNQGR